MGIPNSQIVVPISLLNVIKDLLTVDATRISFPEEFPIPFTYKVTFLWSLHTNQHTFSI